MTAGSDCYALSNVTGCTHFFTTVTIDEPGEVQEWLNWPLSKSGMGQLIEGSNPSLSATIKK